MRTTAHPPRPLRAHPPRPLPGIAVYKRIPRSHTRAQREEATRARLLADIHADSTTRKARRRERAAKKNTEQAS